MKVYIVADMEGVTGVVSRDQLMAPGVGYAAARKLLTADLNAAIEGLLEGAGDERIDDIIVGDGHATMRNVLLEELHPAARLVIGGAKNKPLCQIEGIDEGVDALMMIGFHSRAGTPRGLLAHTFVGRVIHELTIDGEVMGEVGTDARIAGHFGAPLLLVSGADDLAAEVASTVGSHVRYASVKQSIDTTAAICLTPSRAQAIIRDAAREATAAFVATPEDFPATVASSPVTIEIETHHRVMTEQACIISGIERVGERRFATTADDMPAAFRTIWQGIETTMRDYPDWLA
jgi:D-amino peptidase